MLYVKLKNKQVLKKRRDPTKEAFGKFQSVHVLYSIISQNK